MRRTGILVLVIAALAAQVVPGQQVTSLKTEADRASYGIGVGVARNFQNQGMDVELEVLIQGIRDVLTGRKLLMTDDELTTTMTVYTQALRQKQARNDLAAAQNNQKAGDAFRAANRSKPGVKSLPDGLQYKILAPGRGNTPADKDSVQVNYRGTLVDGTVFDKSPTGSPVTLSVASLIPGFKEALKLMAVGSKWQVVIPPELAYGQQRASAQIGPNATLVFEIELVSIQ